MVFRGGRRQKDNFIYENGRQQIIDKHRTHSTLMLGLSAIHWCLYSMLRLFIVHDHDADFDNGNADTAGVDFADDDFADNFYTNDDDLADYFDFAEYFGTDDSDFNDGLGFDFDEDTKSDMKSFERF